MRTLRRRLAAATIIGLLVAALPVAAQAGGHSPKDTKGNYTAIYIYKKVNPNKGASWENSGRQMLVAIRPGLKWFSSIDPKVLKDNGICGPGWGVQEDQIKHIKQSEIPRVVDRATNTGVLGWPPIVAARHQNLEKYVAVPPCQEPDPEPEPEPDPDPTVDPSVEPSEDPDPEPSEDPDPEPSVDPTEVTSEPEDDPVVDEGTVPAEPAKPAAPARPVQAAPSFTG